MGITIVICTDTGARVQTCLAHIYHSCVRANTFFYVICLSLAPNLHVPLIGDVSCLATKQSGARLLP